MSFRTRRLLLLFFTVLAGTGLIHALLLASEIANVRVVFDHSMDRSAYQFERAVAKGDAFELSRLLAFVKEQRINSLEFQGTPPVRIGEIETGDPFLLRVEYNIVVSGAAIGTVIATISPIDVSKEIVGRNFWLYLLFLAVFLAAVASQAISYRRALSNIDVLIEDLANRQERVGTSSLENFESLIAQTPRPQAWVALASRLNELLDVAANIAEARARELMARQVAHDIRSPLSFLRILATKMNASPEGESLGKVAERIEGIAEDLLKKSRPVPMAGEPRQLVWNLNQIVASVLEEKSAQLSQVRVEVDVASTKIRTDKVKIERMVGNILQNSIESLSRAHDPTISISSKVSDNLVQLSISDNGSGISKSELERLNQAKCFTTKANGNGLGVSGSIALARSLGGSLRLESQIGLGTRAVIEIPI